jgi:membrane-bound metal-dependent hydrolase YbcI (DUF457 family)
MKTGFHEHLLAGAACTAIASVVAARAGMPAGSLAFPAALMLASSLLPDVDSPSSKPRRWARAAVLAAAAGIALLMYAPLSRVHYALPLLLPPALFLAFEFAVPRHRGLLHSPLAGIAWGGLAWLCFGWPAGAFAAAGYLCHLAADFACDRV